MRWRARRPVSALIHAATMVNAGVYMVARANPIFAEAPTAMSVVAVIGTFTAIFAAAIALTQNDIKKVLAYSTVSQLATCSWLSAWARRAAAIFHLVTPRLLQGPAVHGRRGRSSTAPAASRTCASWATCASGCRWTYITMVIGSLALAGIPIFAGFFSKDEILAETFNRGYLVFYLVGVVVAFMTAFYTFRMIFMTFWGEWRGPAGRVAPRPRERDDDGRAADDPRGADGLRRPPARHCRRRAASSTAGSRMSSAARRRRRQGSWPGSIAAGEHHGFELIGLGGLLLLVGASVAAAGIWLAYRWYVERVGCRGSLRRADPARPRSGDVPRQREQVLRRRHLRARLRPRRRPAQQRPVVVRCEGHRRCGERRRLACGHDRWLAAGRSRPAASRTMGSGSLPAW